MRVRITRLPFLYKKSYVEINDNGKIFTSVVSEAEKEEIKRDLKGIAKITES